MIWSVEEAIRKHESGEEPFRNARVYAADGTEIKYVVWMDTDTGEVETLRHDGTSFVFEGENTCPPTKTVARDRRTYPAPLTIVECEEVVQ